MGTRVGVPILFLPKRNMMHCKSAALIGLMIALGWMLFFGGRLLVAEDAIHPSAAIVVIGGDHKPARAARVAQLYREGYAPHVIISAGTVVQEGDAQMAEAQVLLRQIIALGVPREAILLEQDSQTTVQNARFTQSLLSQHDIHSIILVTSPYQSSRARRIFRDLLGDAIAVAAQPATDPNFCSVCWLWDSDQRPIVLSEYWKWLVYLTTGH